MGIEENGENKAEEEVNAASSLSRASLTVSDVGADTPGYCAPPLVADVYNNHDSNNNNHIKLLSLSEPDKSSYWRAFPAAKLAIVPLRGYKNGHTCLPFAELKTLSGLHLCTILQPLLLSSNVKLCVVLVVVVVVVWGWRGLPVDESKALTVVCAYAPNSSLTYADFIAYVGNYEEMIERNCLSYLSLSGN
ncbi:unnamed protein product [Pleuronectes platessa]|uniref:Uncharacterized protein n=1 Tax=Pleuronectes platessa TaxID=8262 RepID=A0A9N7YBZ3_PLEPL|nr:unnamed protein product [Pleuronectes platessa]